MEAVSGMVGRVVDGGFYKSFAMVVMSEIGDKTFFIAAIMAMRHSRSRVLAGALGALVAMTVLSAAMGWAAPNLISKYYTSLAATLLFFFFGARLLYDSYKLDASENWGELAEVEAELKEHEDADSKKKRKSVLERVLDPVILEAFSLTFLAEWGDRSQLATIGLATQQSMAGVTLGGVLGHSICTTIAVLGGRHFAAQLSERTVGMAGGVMFLLFGFHSLLNPDTDTA
mmetsp:Transcript_14303/g.30649  ORF Transcript_14303/g.30649 Transcript_14303/m.30649 type:complete len:229 (-) Transcript_14303:613-1299(-)|eukprot:CAMPEP_0118935552 /NCGR_PEP_ID=MMETSP1169-20130426/15706_1 /TAXON_ID=36882 /ORGANISM="Pyramimonas obovata, Strain CCMP722" /LENGTH=228 /DNA_ID=CAMNT_0006878603 /DNA_START=162 /DNA_END=848 /DNA_ORIENTATION=-